MIDIKRLTTVFEEATFDPGGNALVNACESARALLNANAAYFVRLDTPPSFIGDAKIQEIVRDYFADEWWRIDDRSNATGSELALGVRIDDDVISTETRRRSPFLNEFSREFDIPYSASIGFDLGGEHWAFAALRGRSAGPFTEADRALLAPLLPTVKLTSQFALLSQNSRAKGIAQGLEATGTAAVILDHRGLCAYITPRAEALFDEDLSVLNGHLRTADRHASTALAGLHVAAQRGEPSLPLPAIVAQRRDMRRPILISAMWVSGAGLDLLPGARVIVMLIDLDARPRPRATLLQQAFKLTPREAQIAELVGSGRSVEQIAEHLSLRASTVRQMIKAILQKTDTTRQAELVALLARLPQA